MRLGRRAFLIGSASVGGGLVVAGYVLHQPGRNPLLERGPPGRYALNAYVEIAENGEVTVAVPRAEMGQGVHTALAILVADELDVPFDGIQVEPAPLSKHYINHALLETGIWFVLPQNHGRFAESLRSGAEFAMLIRAAAAAWHVDAEGLETDQGKVVDPQSKRMMTYGELARAAATVVLERAVEPGQRAFRLIGKTAKRLDTRDKVNGKAIFGIDHNVDSGSTTGAMLYAAVRSAPTLSGSIATFDKTSVTSRKGIRDAMRVDDRTVAVIADSYWTAQRAVDSLPLTFTDQDTWLSSDAVLAEFGRRIATERGHAFRHHGDAPAQLAQRQVIESEYWAPYLAHTCMEPLNCTARFAQGGCELWLGTQAPALVASAVAEALALCTGDVKVNTTLLGGGFGRRLEVDVAVQAARIAKAQPDQTVKLIWSREEDVRRDVFRPAARARLTGALDQNGYPEVLFARICSQSVMRDFAKRNLGWPFPLPDKTNAEGLYDQPYAIPHYRVEHVEADNAIPVGNWRGVGHGFNGFAMECFLDELARAGGRDAIEVRRHLLQEHCGKIALLDRLKELSRWGGPKSAGIDGRGFAYRQNFDSDVAQVVDIAVEGRRIKVKQVYCVIDCGQPVDRRGIEAQVESGIIYGLSAALMQAITIKDGRVQQSNLHQFDSLRMNECPEITIDIMQNRPEIGGAGETAVPPVAAALANALFDATGRRVRQLPLRASFEAV